MSESDRQTVEAMRSKRRHHAGEVNRAHILATLDRDVPQAVIIEVLSVGHTAIRRTRAAYWSGDPEHAPT